MKKKIALLWEPEIGLYSNRSFDDVYRAVGANSGNVAFVHAVERHVVGEVTRVPWHATKEALAPFDVAVMPCANQLGAHTDLGKLAALHEKAGKPIVAIGLGAQARSTAEDIELTEGTLAWVKVIDAARPASASNIWTRGPYTTKQLGKIGIGDSVTGCCPSLFINPAPDLGHRVSASWEPLTVPRGISVAAGLQSWKHLQAIEHQLAALMQDSFYPGQYVTQSAADMVRASRGEFDAIEPQAFEALRQYIAPHLTDEQLRTWCRTYARTYFDVPSWMDSLRRHDLAIGTRYHGTALAIQAERMALSITIDSRTEELCDETGVPWVRASALADKPLTRSFLKKTIKFDPAKYDLDRSNRAKAYVAFLENNGLQPADFLKRIAAAA